MFYTDGVARGVVSKDQCIGGARRDIRDMLHFDRDVSGDVRAACNGIAGNEQAGWDNYFLYLTGNCVGRVEWVGDGLGASGEEAN